MAGLALTDNFMLTTATVMIGPVANLHDLNPVDHSIGLVKNFQCSSEPAYTELTQGVKGTIVFSVLTSNPVRASMEVFEYTAKNLNFALGLDGTNVNALSTVTTTTGAISASPVTSVLPVTSATGIIAGKTLLIDKNNDDDFVIRKVVSVASLNVTVDQPLPAMASGVSVYVVNVIDVGSKTEQPFLAAKVAGKLANGKHVVILFPKIRITKGFNMQFTSDNYGNMPFEFAIYDLVSTDSAFAYFGGASAKIFTR